LEERINAMQSQMLVGGSDKRPEETTEFRAMLQEEHERIRTEVGTQLNSSELESAWFQPLEPAM
jgi:hypothetical protein